MSWLDVIQIGNDLKVCPDCNRAYEVTDEFLAKRDEAFPVGDDWLDEMFSEEYYIALRCPQCLETRHLCLKSLTQKQYQSAQEER
ncbi:MAG: hypothetical protein O7E52_09455 [Candidatus Poribacteria bacterium]|nr:hypothetical protein [Candidatus Poribacteria bacterium]